MHSIGQSSLPIDILPPLAKIQYASNVWGVSEHSRYGSNTSAPSTITSLRRGGLGISTIRVSPFGTQTDSNSSG